MVPRQALVAEGHTLMTNRDATTALGEHARIAGEAHRERLRRGRGPADGALRHVARAAIVTGLLPRETIPAELLAALQPILAFYERKQAAPEQEAE
jgi:hypothetical protein